MGCMRLDGGTGVDVRKKKGWAVGGFVGGLEFHENDQR